MPKGIKKKTLIDKSWVFKIILFTFITSMIFSYGSDIIISKSGIIVSIFVLLLFIFLGIIFDIIGIAVTASDEKTFHSMASKRVKGAKLAIRLKQSSPKVSNFCNDVVGDICGIISGSAGATIAVVLSSKYKIDISLVVLIMTSLIASLTIGGKALGKGYAVKKSNEIHLRFAQMLSIFVKDK